MEEKTFFVGLGVAIVAAFLQFVKVPPQVAWGGIGFGLTLVLAAILPTTLRPTTAQMVCCAIGVAIISSVAGWQFTLDSNTVQTLASPLSTAPPTPPSPSVAAQQRDVLRQLTQLYILSHDGISPRMAAGLELPPADFINAELERQHAVWRVSKVDGAEAETYDLKP